MTQINFYMSRKDEADFLAYVRSRGGYLARFDEVDGDFRVEDADQFENRSFSEMALFLSSVFPSSGLTDLTRRMKSYHGYQFWGPGIAYQSSGLYIPGIVRARFWYDVSALSFLPALQFRTPPMMEGVQERFAPQVKAMDNFYQSICGFIRKRYRSDGGVWHGPDGDLLEASGTPKFQHITEAGPVPQHGFSCLCPKCVDWRPDPTISPYKHWSEATASEQLAIWRGVAVHYEKRTAKGLRCQYKEPDYSFALGMIKEIESAFPNLKAVTNGQSA